MLCKGCNQDKKLIKAHIIPASFFRGLKNGGKPLRLHSTKADTYPKRSHVGVYDPGILCSDCEEVFKAIDDFGYNLLINNENDAEQLYHLGQHVGFKFSGVDYQKIKLFFLSILWRASVSKQKFYSKINLGSFEARLKEMIWNGETGGKHDFSFVLGKFEGDGMGRALLDPHPERWYGVKYYRFYLYGYILHIKADSQKTPQLWEKFISEDNNSLIGFSRGFIEDSKEYSILQTAVQKPEKRNEKNLD